MPERFGFDAPKNLPVEDSIAWGAANGFRYLDFNADMPPNALASFDDARAAGVRQLLEESGMQMGVHPISALCLCGDEPVRTNGLSPTYTT